MGLWNIIKPTNIMLFENNRWIAMYWQFSATLILFASIIMTVTAILQGLGYTLFPAIQFSSSFL